MEAYRSDLTTRLSVTYSEGAILGHHDHSTIRSDHRWKCALGTKRRLVTAITEGPRKHHPVRKGCDKSRIMHCDVYCSTCFQSRPDLTYQRTRKQIPYTERSIRAHGEHF